jgi:hypothetical protein
MAGRDHKKNEGWVFAGKVSCNHLRGPCGFFLNRGQASAAGASVAKQKTPSNGVFPLRRTFC